MTDTTTTVEINFGIIEHPTTLDGKMYAPYIQLVTASGTVFNFDSDQGFRDRSDCEEAVHAITDLMLGMDESKEVK